jgi:hypothetical protein
VGIPRSIKERGGRAATPWRITPWDMQMPQENGAPGGIRTHDLPSEGSLRVPFYKI